MNIITVAGIDGLAQNFLKAPRVLAENNGLYITYDFEEDSGEYGEKSIFFEVVKDHNHIRESDITTEIIDAAYNSIAKVIDSARISSDLLTQGYNHLIIYFEEYGAFEVIAKSFRFE